LVAAASAPASSAVAAFVPAPSTAAAFAPAPSAAAASAPMPLAAAASARRRRPQQRDADRSLSRSCQYVMRFARFRWFQTIPNQHRFFYRGLSGLSVGLALLVLQ
jgi:hypothetical protein